jgi:hypothetical protein
LHHRWQPVSISRSLLQQLQQLQQLRHMQRFFIARVLETFSSDLTYSRGLRGRDALAIVLVCEVAGLKTNVGGAHG